MRFYSSYYCVVHLLGVFISASAQSLSCGSVGDDFTITPGDLSVLTLSKSASQALCMLFRVTAIDSAIDLDSINSGSNLSDYNIVPVARSYDTNKWQRVAGSYAQNLQITCTDAQCTLNIPSLSGNDEGRFVLMPFQHSLENDKAIVSRFFHQTTFGPTMTMINDWNYTAPDMVTEMASWVKDQMNSASNPETLHREFFRKRVNGELEQEEEAPQLAGSRKQMFKVRNPCHAGSRWVKHAFSTDDYTMPLTATQQANGSWLLKVNDVPRTIVISWKDTNGNDLGPGPYLIQFRVDEMLGGRFAIRNSIDPTYIYVEGGNPAVFLPIDTGNITFVDLPPEDNFVNTPAITSRNNWDIWFDETLYLANDLTDPRCSLFDFTNTLNIVGKLGVSGDQVRYGRYVEFEKNTLESPIPSGGADLEACSNPLMDWKNSESCHISNEPACTTFTFENLDPNNSATVVCGSPSEVENDPFGQSIFHLASTTRLKSFDSFAEQKKSAWSMIAIDENTKDQLRQRVAWALSQILVITPNQIENEDFSEMHLSYYDIFVKNAFTNYFDILKEVSYSPMMGEMLGFVGSKSKPYVLKENGIVAFPDENYAREIMQLFSIGIHQLEMDGTLKLDTDGSPILSYSAEDIQNFARAWTGFTHSPRRANSEAYYWDIGNRIDPMILNGLWRDHSPKADLHGGYIGDRYPLCTDLPDKHFLKKGASFQLRGSSKMPTLHSQPTWWFGEDRNIKVLELSLSSQLYEKLCNADTDGTCDFAPVVTLDDANIDCDSIECMVDDLRLIKVQSNPDIHYEYIRVPCVEQTFYQNSKTVQALYPYDAMCANGDLPLATDACCDNPTWSDPGGRSSCEYSVEKTTFLTSETRCKNNFGDDAVQCAWNWQKTSDNDKVCHWGHEDDFYWASPDPCILKAKVSNSGTVAIVHNPVSSYDTDINVDADNTNFFKVAWNGDHPRQTDSTCDSTTGCTSIGIDCLCNITISELPVFSSLPSVSDIKANLRTGGFQTDEFTLLVSTPEIEVFEKNFGGYDKETLFKVDYFGEPVYFKNTLSTVEIDNGTFSFRNPVQFLNPALREGRDAQYETDAVLRHYLQHPNLPPFLAKRMIQRFGTSNPSPGFTEAVALAFKRGLYSRDGVEFGDRRYGSMEAMVAAIVLHDEARTIVLDADPTAGSLREPLLKVVSFLRSMEFSIAPDAPALRLLNMQQRIGQMAHSTPNVFSFFLPEYATPGHINGATIASPEGQVMNGPSLTSIVNGIFALVDVGLNDCYGGFGDTMTGDYGCSRILSGSYSLEDYSRGTLKYTPSDLSASAVVSDLDLLLTSGRLEQSKKLELEDAYSNLGGLSAVQKLITTTPEFHATGLANSQTSSRPEPSSLDPSDEPYKAVIFLNLAGGADTYNFLVPHSGCSEKDMYQEYSTVRGVLALDNSTLLQIDATESDQVCNTFGLHPKLQTFQSLYSERDLLFIANMGVLQEYATKSDWKSKTQDTALFAHNTQQNEVQRMDIFEDQAGRGVGGRMLDVLGINGYKVNAVSTKGATDALSADDTPLIIVPSVDQYEKFDPMSSLGDTSDPDRYISRVKDLNAPSKLGSSLFSETYSSILHQGINENQLLFDALQGATLGNSFPSSNIGNQLEAVATMIKTKDVRGVDRDVFYVKHDGYDTHTDLEGSLDSLLEDLNASVEAFVTEMKDQGIWNEGITIVTVSEFARTLTPNTGAGSDHAWGANMMVLGGSVEGKQILGAYPDDLTVDGPQITNERGIVLPTTPWDSMWNGVAQWFGVTEENELNTIIPNRNSFEGTLFTSETLYGITTTSSPSISNAPIGSSTPSPTNAPSLSIQPTTSPTEVNPKIIDFSWFIPGTTLFEPQTVLVGATVRFNWSGTHNVYISSDGTCEGTLTEVGLSTGTTYTFATESEVVFICNIGNGVHCNAGQRVTFNVVASFPPTNSPTQSSFPSISPTKTPTLSPTKNPTRSPSRTPTKSPVRSPSESPSKFPTRSPSETPTTSPVSSPSESPSRFPTRSPSKTPTKSPISSPTQIPSKFPTRSPSETPTTSPVSSPSESPSRFPTRSPSETPTTSPVSSPSESPSKFPTEFPTIFPSKNPAISGPNDQCYEDSRDKFLKRVTNSGVVRTNSCNYLAMQNPQTIQSYCEQTLSAGGYFPAKDVCKVTCNQCPGGCNEISNSKFYWNTFKERDVVKRCSYLTTNKPNWSASELSEICNRNAPDGLFNGSVQCPITCGTC